MNEIDDYMLKVPREIRWRHFIYRFNMMGLLTFAYLIGAYPDDLFYYFYSVMTPLRLSMRFIDYYQTGKHFYFLDFCYVGSITVWVFVNFFPKNLHLFHISNNLAFGVLLLSHYTFNDAIDLGHMDRHISTTVHLVPALVMYNVNCVTMKNQAGMPDEQRWFLAHDRPGFNDSFSYLMSSEGFYWNLQVPIIFYIAWPVMNYFIVFYMYWSTIVTNKYTIQYIN